MHLSLTELCNSFTAGVIFISHHLEHVCSLKMDEGNNSG